jgi:5'-nucleotidase
MTTKRILISNDDGVFHPALWALVRAVKHLGDVVVSAPDRNRSGVGTAMTLHDPVRVNEVPSLEAGVRAFAVQGMPADAVVLGLRELADGPVDAVVSGINPGNNVTTNVLVSGTLGAAYAGHLNGVPSMAVSVGYQVDPADEQVRRVTAAAVEALMSDGSDALVNLNIPWAQDWPLRGCRVTVPAPRVLQDNTKRDEEAALPFYWIYRGLIEGTDMSALPEDSDMWALQRGFVSVGSLAWSRNEEHDGKLMERIAEAVRRAIGRGQLQ